ncbi:MAG: autotransporter domain-containing protein, partial [Planctomycetota bacterium]|nr:autotransporter domain-containing protein [Planctomycetota bacterium]
YSPFFPTVYDDPYNLRYDAAFAGVYRLRVGAGLNYVIPQKKVSFGGAAYYQHRWGDLALNTPIHFTNDPRGNRYTSRGDALAPDVLGLNANVRAQLTDRLSATVSYDFNMGENERSHRGQIGLALEF